MDIATILSLIGFAITEEPIVVNEVKSLVSYGQAVTSGNVPDPTDTDIANAVAARKAAQAAADATE